MESSARSYMPFASKPEPPPKIAARRLFNVSALVSAGMHRLSLGGARLDETLRLTVRAPRKLLTFD